MRKALFILSLALVPNCPPIPLWAQTVSVASEADRRTIEDLIAQADVILESGDRDRIDEALTLIYRANDITFTTDDLDIPTRYLPNLAAARAFRLKFDWPEVERYAAAVARAFDAPGLQDHPYRIEAAGRLGHALLRQDRGIDALAILRPVLAQIDAGGGADTREKALVEFWLAATLARLGEGEWSDLGLRTVNTDTDQSMISTAEFVSFLYDFLGLLRSTEGASDTLLGLSQTMANAARGETINAVDRAFYMDFHAKVLHDMDQTAEAADLMVAELTQLGDNYIGHRARNLLGIRLVVMWFNMGRVDEGLGLIETLVDEIEQSGSERWEDIYYLKLLEGRALEYRGEVGPSQVAFRAAYAAVRKFDRASSGYALMVAEFIDRSDPGFADFAYAAELADPSALPPDGPPEDVAARFLAGNFALNERIFQLALETEGQDRLEVEANRVLHHALAGPESALEERLAIARSLLPEDDAQMRDRLTFYEAFGAFWLGSRRPMDRPELFAALDGLEARLPPDQQSVVRALRFSTLNFEGRTVEARAALRDWIAKRDMARQPRSVWDIMAAMMATEIGYNFLDLETATSISQDSFAELSAFPELSLAKDYLDLVRLLNAARDMETDRGIVELAAIVQRISAEVPEGHILRASSRFGMANALWSRERLAEARDMMAQTVEEFRANPRYRPDILAFLQALQSQLLSQMGQYDLAMTLARAAYEALPTDARGDYRLTVVSRLVWEFYSSGRLDEAIAMSESELADPELMNSLLPAQQVDAYRTRAALLRYVGREEESRTLLDQAAEVVRTSTDMPPMPGIMLLWDIAVAHHGQGRLDEAFRNMTASNDGYFAERQKVASASASGQAAQKNEDLIRAQTEADIGWALYQELSKTPTALP